jgi:hypothetical protein
MVVCGMALGYAAPGEIINTFRTEREAVANYTRFLEG